MNIFNAHYSKSHLLMRMVLVCFLSGSSIAHALYVAPYTQQHKEAGNTVVQGGTATTASVPLTPQQQAEQQIAAYDLFIQRFSDSEDATQQTDVASAYFNKAKLLASLNQLDDAGEGFDQLIARFGNATFAQSQVAYAYLGKMLILSQQGQKDQSLATADELIKKFSDTQDDFVKESVAKAYLAKSALYGESKDFKKAAVASGVLIKKYNNEKSEAIRKQVSQAYVNNILFLANAGEVKEALKTFDQYMQYADMSEPTESEYIVYAYFNKGIAYRAAARYQEAIATYSQLIQQFSQNDLIRIKGLVASAYSNKAESQIKLQQYDAALTVVKQALAQYSTSNEPSLQEVISTLYNNAGFIQFLQAKQLWSSNHQIALSNLNNAKQSYEKAFAVNKPMNISHTSLYENYAYTMWLLGDKQLAEKNLKQALLLGGTDAYQGAIDDMNMHPITEDVGFKVLLTKLWAEQKIK